MDEKIKEFIKLLFNHARAVGYSHPAVDILDKPLYRLGIQCLAFRLRMMSGLFSEGFVAFIIEELEVAYPGLDFYNTRKLFTLNAPPPNYPKNPPPDFLRHHKDFTHPRLFA